MNMNRKAPEMTLLHEDRLFSANPVERDLARALYASISDLPILSPHGHTDPRWFAEDAAFPDPAQLIVTPDHYVFRMLCSQGVSLADLGVDAGEVGLSVAWSQVEDTAARPPRTAGEIVTDEDGSGAGALVDFLASKKFI